MKYKVSLVNKDTGKSAGTLGSFNLKDALDQFDLMLTAFKKENHALYLIDVETNTMVKSIE